MGLPQEARCLDKENLYATIDYARGGWYSTRFMSGNNYLHWGNGKFVKQKKEKLQVEPVND